MLLADLTELQVAEFDFFKIRFMFLMFLQV